MTAIELFNNLNPILLNIGHNTMAEGIELKNINSPFSRVLYIIGGEGRIIHNGITKKLKKNHIYGILPYYKVDFIVDSDLELYYFHVYSDSLSCNTLLNSYQFKIEVEAIPLDRLLIERMLEINLHKQIKDNRFDTPDEQPGVPKKAIIQQRENFCVSFETEIMIMQLFSRFLSPDKRPINHLDSRIIKAIQYVNNNIESEISEDKLAEIASMSKDYFIRLFKKEINNTPCKYINEKKVECAQIKLLISDISVKDLAIKLGYSDTSYFIRVFTKIVGKTPYKYRSCDL